MYPFCTRCVTECPANVTYFVHVNLLCNRLSPLCTLSVTDFELRPYFFSTLILGVETKQGRSSKSVTHVTAPLRYVPTLADAANSRRQKVLFV